MNDNKRERTIQPTISFLSNAWPTNIVPQDMDGNPLFVVGTIPTEVSAEDLSGYLSLI